MASVSGHTDACYTETIAQYANGYVIIGQIFVCFILFVKLTILSVI